MKTKALYATMLGALLLAPAGAGAASWEEKLQKLYPAAKAEGKLIFNARRIAEMGGKDGVAKFKKRFPGIDITFTGVSASKLPARLVLEAKSGKVSVDGFRSDVTRAELLAEKGLLMKIDLAEITNSSPKTFLNGQLVKLSDHITNFVVNTSLVKKADWPKSYEDLLDPKWKRRLILDARGGQIAHLLSLGIWGEDKFWKFVKGLQAQNPVWASRNSEAMAKLTSGEGYISTGSYVAISNLKAKGAPVEFLFLSPSLAENRTVGILKPAPHPNAAKLFIGWLLSPEGVKARDKYGVSSIEPGTTLYERVKAANAEVVTIDTRAQIEKIGEVGEKIEQEWGVITMKKKKKK